MGRLGIMGLVPVGMKLFSPGCEERSRVWAGVFGYHRLMKLFSPGGEEPGHVWLSLAAGDHKSNPSACV